MIVLASGLTSHPDVRARVSLRTQLETAGLLRVFEKIKTWNDRITHERISEYEQDAEGDRADLQSEQDQVMMSSFRSPEDVFRALLHMTSGTKASSYLFNALRHLLLIKEQGDEKIRYFQLIDQLITSIVMNDTPELGSDFSQAFGISVSHLVGKFVEQEKMDASIQEIKGLKASLAKAVREKMDLSEEISKGDEGMVGDLKTQVADLEDRLRKSRAATETVMDQMEGMKRDYESRLDNLQLYIDELFKMLLQTSHLEEVAGMTEGPIDRRRMIHDLREKWERKRTIEKLEGKGRRRKDATEINGDEESEGDVEGEDDEVEVLTADKVSVMQVNGGRDLQTLSRSQFADAEDEWVRSHIEASLVKGADGVVGCMIRRVLT